MTDAVEETRKCPRCEQERLATEFKSPGETELCKTCTPDGYAQHAPRPTPNERKRYAPPAVTTFMPTPHDSSPEVATYPALRRRPEIVSPPRVSAFAHEVDAPSHYLSGKGIECIDAIAEAVKDLQGLEAFCTANAMKYLWRWKKKNGVEDLKKALWYIERIVRAS